MKYIIAVLLTVSVVCSGFAETVPPLINYQGMIKNDAGTPYATGFYNVDFRMYNEAAGGTLLWSERYNLYVMDGQFNVILGQGGSAVPGDNPAFTSLMKVFEAGTGYDTDMRFLSLAVNGGSEFSPRQRLLSAPYAVRSDMSRFADTALNASNAAHATKADRAANADNADKATAASTANQAGNAAKLGNQEPAYYAEKHQFSVPPAGNWQAQFWSGTNFHNGPLYWMHPTIGVGGEPGLDTNVGLRMVNGSLRPKSGEGWNSGLIFQQDPSKTAYWMFQTTSGNGNVQELYLKTQGDGEANTTISANKGVLVRGDKSVTCSGGSQATVQAPAVTIAADSQLTMQTPLINSSALKSGCRIVWPNFSATKGDWQYFTAEGDGLLIVNAKQMLWEMEVPNHMDGDFTGNDRRRFELRFAKNNVEDSVSHSFVWPLKKDTRIGSCLKEVWGGNFWWIWVIYFN